MSVFRRLAGVTEQGFSIRPRHESGKVRSDSLK